MRVLAYLKVPEDLDKSTLFSYHFGSGSGCGKIGGYSSGGQETALWAEVNKECNKKRCKILALIKQRSEQGAFQAHHL